jgi:glutaredoxin 3
MSKVNIYSTATCHFCNLAKDFFKANDIEYTEFNVGEDVEKRNEMLEKTGQMGVPVIVVEKEGEEEQVVVGFEESKIRELLGM